MMSLAIATFRNKMDREEREWSTRLVTSLLASALVWCVVVGLALLSTHLAISLKSRPPTPITILIPTAWGVLSVLAAKFAKVFSVRAFNSIRWKRVLFLLAPPFFLIGLLLGVDLTTAWSLLSYEKTAQWTGCGLLGLFGGMAALFVMSGWMLDPNEFSLHGFYRDRIVRCFLGASNADTLAPDSVWNIKTDDLHLTCLKESITQGAPFHIINSAVNLFGSKSLKVRQRNCDNFILTPTSSGSRVTNYIDTPDSLYLGTACAISGAAVGSGMGLATQGAGLAALMTIFNVRLGYWFENPKAVKNENKKLKMKGHEHPSRKERWKRPGFSPLFLMAEAFSLTNEERNFVNLSDGGHFDNLGLYELIRRRCKFIIVVDSEHDPNYNFTSLGEVIRLARIDFGIEIKIDLKQIAPSKETTTYASGHFALGEIDYSAYSGNEYSKKGASHLGETQKGTLLYIKSTLLPADRCAHISSDVLEYAKSHPDFPHDSTADQFFSEAQFESYRKLGECIAENVFGRLRPNYSDIEDIISELKQLREKS
ncbi:MAG: hypothetical protein HYR79_12355 [Nitrospirae bacterium]|nr:hypothetical protein [Nitrospirota bacterium]